MGKSLRDKKCGKNIRRRMDGFGTVSAVQVPKTLEK